MLRPTAAPPLTHADADAATPRPQINWGVDLTEGKAADPWKNALLSEDAKEAMWAMHKQEGCAESCPDRGP